MYLDRIHIFGGLFCAAYLLLIGFTSLLFSHEKIIPNHFRSSDHVYAISADRNLEKDSLISVVREQLGYIGYQPYWMQKEDSVGNFHFQIANPAAIYDIDVNPKRDTARVLEKRKGVINIMISLHGSSGSELPVWIITLWRIYALIATVVAIVVLLISIYFWFKKAIKKRSQWILVAGTSIFSLLYILFIWLIG